MNLIDVRTNKRQMPTGLTLLVFIFLLGAVTPVNAANFDPKKPLPHKQQVNTQPTGDEDPHSEIMGIAPEVRQVSSGWLRIAFAFMSNINFQDRGRRLQVPRHLLL